MEKLDDTQAPRRGSGKIDVDEWRKALNQPSIVNAINTTERKELEHIASTMDRDGDGKLSVPELLQA